MTMKETEEDKITAIKQTNIPLELEENSSVLPWLLVDT